MSLREVGFKIKLPLDRETIASRKSLDSWRKGFSDMEKKEIPKLHARTKGFLKDTREGLREVDDHAKRVGSSLSRSFKDGLEGINRFNEKLHKTRERVFGLKEAFEATLIGGGVFYGAEKLLEAGRGELRTRRTLRREFTGRDNKFVTEAAERLARGAGIEGAEAAQALIPLARTLRDQVQAGAQFRGMRAPLTAYAAESMRERNLQFGASLIKRMAILNPEIGAAEIGQIMNDALTGPEGIRRLQASFGLNKSSQVLARANEQGNVFKVLSPEERKRFGITKAGQRLEMGDAVSLMLERSGFTARAAEEEMKTLDYQIKSIGSSLKTTFGEIGESVLSQFDGGLGQGLTMSERLDKYLKDHKKDIEDIGKNLGLAAKSVGEFASKLPEVGGFLSEHKTALLALGGGFLGFKALAGVGGMLDNVRKVPGLGKTFGSVSSAAAIPVRVVNWGEKGGILEEGKSSLGSGVKGMAKYGLGGALGAIGATAALTAGFAYWAGNQNESMVEMLEKADKERQAKARANEELIKKTLMVHHGDMQIFDNAGQPMQVQLHAHIHMDGRKVAEVVSEHQVRGVKRATGNGASPTHRE